jgi:hypothetical protein
MADGAHGCALLGAARPSRSGSAWNQTESADRPERRAAGACNRGRETGGRHALAQV